MKIDGKTYLFFANFSGITPGVNLTPTTQENVTVTLPDSAGTSMHVLPFLGVETVVKGTRTGERVSFVVPPMGRGTIVWFR